MTRKVYEVLAEAFLQEEIDTCFALLGDANMNWATTLGERGTRMLYLRHEHCAVSAAMSYARSSGRVGIATVTCGPGLTQTLTALPAAVRASLPLVIFAGESPLGAAWYNQQIDQAPLITATGAAYIQMHSIKRMPTQIRDAFVQAQEEGRPVVLGVPFDLQDAEWPGGDLPAPSAHVLPKLAPMPPHPDAIAELAAKVRAARRVVVMAGLGAARADATAACTALAERTGALLATTLPARGLFHDAPFHVGVAGGFSTAVARACFAEADLVVAVGARLTQHNLDKGKLFPKAEIVQIDLSPRALSQGRVAADHHLRADARLGVEALVEALGSEPVTGWRSPELARAIAETPADPAEFPADGDLLDPRDVVAALDRALPGDWQLVNSSGHCSFYFAQMCQRPFEKFTTIREFGAIGNGISYAIGVAAAHPDQTVVLFDGDGSLLMHIQELEAIRRHGLNILICALNDGAYGSEIHKLRDEGLPDTGAVFGHTDLAAIARGFGVGGETVTELARLPDLVAGFTASGGAALWDFPISDRIASPVIRRAHPGGHAGQERPVSVDIPA
ncbi:decarboxylase (plasmid) [Pacificitalea manganoxidans]|uniref:Decarboxylase n=1 Tax=Pacificitalea manganoxidans TaxID=1411902 RepID=A0A291M4J6_9RHOB|nr:thiamine pyrophosphate-binding protein [Pacificitalea manganoxidans]ATI43849.1 decarboxylase [Pacificitalea manganoxidans]MDR6310253.1 thiamine pyrophosphate-dependent acetolactate synthase large subunit-like protein [Pacificitalea manganoxidans]